MANFRINNLSEKTRIMHDTQMRWREKNWKESLKKNNFEIEKLLSLIELFDIWKNRLQRNEAIRLLSREIYTDAYFSIHLSCFGLYKYAHMSLRSVFETTLRLIYFSNHQLELEWWQSGEEKWIGDLLKGMDVWGQNFKYFAYIPQIKIFEENCPPDKWLLKGDNPKLKVIYSKLSKHVHSVGPYLQTRHGSLSPKYKQTEFQNWCEIFKEVQRYVNILLALCFSEKFKNMPTDERNRILDEAVGVDYKNIVKHACGL
jgi:hypothetical protein